MKPHAVQSDAAAPRTYRVLILPEHIEVSVPKGTLLFDVLCAHIPFDPPCGGNGTCKKCLVEITVEGRTERVLACQTRVHVDMHVMHAPEVSLHVLTTGAPSAGVPAAAVVSHASYTPSKPLAAAFDVGTTTLVCSLLEPATGQVLGVSGAGNPQSAFGADVMARLGFAIERSPVALQAAVVSGMNDLLSDVCNKAGVSTKQVARLTAVGNSAMQALLLGRAPATLVRPPYAPESCEAVQMRAASIGLCAAADAMLTVLPLIGGFVGADTTACLLATGFDTLPGTTLLVDIGTNGELVLGNTSRRVACSAAAGPAFEGTNLQCGMRAAQGAIDQAEYIDGQLLVHVLGGGAPRGICGSGLTALAAALLTCGALDETGRLVQRGPLGNRIVDFCGQAAFVVSDCDSSASGEQLLLTQKDLRALQLAKGAISAGVAVLCDRLGIQADAIDRILLSGAFGSFLRVHDACRIGLLPAALESRTQTIGNAAIEGAKLVAQRPETLQRAVALARGTEHIALASAPDYEDRLLDALSFGPTSRVNDV